MITLRAILTALAWIAWISGAFAQEVPAPQPNGSGKTLPDSALREVPFLGVIVTENPDSNAGGLVILDQILNGPASKAGLQANDILFRMDDQILLLRQQLGLLIKRHQVGDSLTFTYRRSGDDQDRIAKVILVAAPSPATQVSPSGDPKSELTMANPRMTQRTVRIRDSQHAISITTIQGHPFLTVRRLPTSDVEFEGTVTSESIKELSADIQQKVQRVAKIEEDRWVFELPPPLRPPIQLPPNTAPRSPAPELDQPTHLPMPPTTPQQ